MEHKWVRIVQANLAACLVSALLLVYQNYLGGFAWSQAIALAVVIILGNAVWYARNWYFMNLDRLASLVGLDSQSRFVSWVGVTLGVILSVGWLSGGVTGAIPPAMQFQIIPASATLGGLLIAAVNLGKFSMSCRKRLLRDAQKFISATVFLAVFSGLFVIVDTLKVDPNKFAWGTDAIVRGVFFWSAIVLFFSGISLFTLGIVDLLPALKELKEKGLKGEPRE